jgi:hypothetical protein
VDTNTVIMEGFNTSLSLMDRSTKNEQRNIRVKLYHGTNMLISILNIYISHGVLQSISSNNIRTYNFISA